MTEQLFIFGDHRVADKKLKVSKIQRSIQVLQCKKTKISFHINVDVGIINLVKKVARFCCGFLLAQIMSLRFTNHCQDKSRQATGLYLTA